MALSESPSTTELKEVAAQYPDVEVTRQDSLDTGNCESGTDDFLEQFFNGRTSVKVSELAQYIEDYNGVRLVLEFKFRQLEEQAAEDAATKSEDTSEDNWPF